MKPLLLLSLAVSLSALDVDVDQGYGFFTSSHHLHFAGGAAMGATGYAGLRVIGLEERGSFWGSVAGGSIVAIAYEIKNDQRGQDSFADPVDAGYTIGGTVIGAAVAWFTEETVEVCLSKDSFALAWSFRH